MDVTGLSVWDAAREAPDRDALVADGVTHSWGALAQRAAAVCDGLHALGITPAHRVALRAHNHVDTVVVLLALISRGVSFVPIHPRSTASEAAGLLADADVARVLDDAAVHALAAETPQTNSPCEDRWELPSTERVLAMLYTSGTTGQPKGAMLTRGAFAASALASAKNLGWRDDDRWLACMPLCHVGGLSILTRCLIARRCVVLQRGFDPEEVLNAVATHAVTLASVVPTMLQRLLRADTTGVLSRLRAVLVGGAAVSPKWMTEAVGRGVFVLGTYGLTEACSQVTVQRLEEVPTYRPGSGRALDGVEVTVVDADGKMLETGGVGRIQVRGPSVMLGYWRHPPLDGAWLDTGDLGALDPDGTLRVYTRRTDLIVTGGENVYPAEVEHALEALPGVSRAMVFGVEDEVWGESVAAAMVYDKGRVPDTHEEREVELAVARTLAVHKRPRRVCWVRDLPMRASGKVDRAEGVRRYGQAVRPWCSG